jgi:alkylation response protein AidB-like acyl-CoA dehydrogenase
MTLIAIGNWTKTPAMPWPKRDFIASLCQQHLGGLEASPVISAQVFERLAQGNAACGWVAFIAATSGSTLASIPEESAKQIFAHPNVMVAGVFAPSGKAHVEENGVTVNGRWQWGSGTQNADWVLGGCMVDDGSEQPSQHMVLMPASAISFLDTWHVSGLQGTGQHRLSSDGLTGIAGPHCWLQQDPPALNVLCTSFLSSLF